MRDTNARGRLLALVEALHPDGAIDDVQPGRASGESVPAVVFARDLPRELDDHSIAWVAVPPLRRRRARAELHRRGLVVESSWLPLPRTTPRLLLPLRPVSGAVRRRLLGDLEGGWRLRLVAGWSARVLEALLPGVGLLARAPAARRSLAWLGEAGVAGPVAIASSWHKSPTDLVLAGEGRIVKSGRAGSVHDPRHEAASLRELGPSARSAGARIPQVLYADRAGRRIALVEDAIPGARAAQLLHRQPDRLDVVAGLVARWLERWHTETCEQRSFGERELERLALEPARKLSPLLPDGTRYLARLGELGSSLYGSAVPFVAAHNDLTTWNILVDGDALGVVDWEAATPETLPLVDLEYFAVDALAVACRLRREEAFRLWTGEGRRADAIRALRDETCATLGLDPALAELARHACWLGHALDEDSRSSSAAGRPFLEIMTLVAAR
jgi:hypothetical protein